MFLLDTDTCIHLVRGNAFVLQKLREHRREDIHIAILTVYELEVGLGKATVQIQKKRAAVDKMLELCSIAPFDQAAAGEAATIRTELEKSGSPIGSIDYLIAGIARANHWTVVTGNLGEFGRVKGLKIEKWHE